MDLSNILEPLPKNLKVETVSVSLAKRTQFLICMFILPAPAFEKL